MKDEEREMYLELLSIAAESMDAAGKTIAVFSEVPGLSDAAAMKILEAAAQQLKMADLFRRNVAKLRGAS